jgi:hypothetical protein
MSSEHTTQKRPSADREPQRPRPPAARAAAPSAPGAAVLRLQASAGNQAVARMLGRSEAAAPAAAQPTAAAAAPAAAPEQSWWRSAIDKVASSARERLLSPLAGIARRVPGYDLLTVALGRDPVSGQTVERSGMAIVRGVAALIPGGAAVLANLEQSGALQRAGAWLSAEVPKLGLTWEGVGGLFARAFSALKASDLLNPAAAWERLAGIFGPPLARLRDFGAAALGKLREFVFEGALAMGGGVAGPVLAVLRRGGSVLSSIFANPVGFAGNLMEAVRGGLGRFAANIGTHLKTGLFGWLFGALRGVIELPKRLDLAGVGSIVLQVLGLTWGRLRERLVGRLGGPRVAFLERSVDFVQRIATEGLSAVWSKVIEFASGLTETVVGAIRDWVTNSIVGAAITRLVTMFNPVGALIQAILSIYRSIQWLLQKADQLRSLASSVFDSIAAIASGSLGGAISAVENALARTLPVVISFLASQLGLGNIAEHIRGVIDRIRATVERAIGRVVEWVVGRFRGSRGDQAAGGRQPEPETSAAAGAAPTRRGEAQFEIGGARHSAWVDETAKPARVIVASQPQPVEQLVGHFLEKIPELRRSGRLTQQDEMQISTSVQRVLTLASLIRQPHMQAHRSSLMRDCVSSLRGVISMLGNKIERKRRNVAVAHAEINGESFTLAALSGETDGQLEREIEPGDNRFFETFEVPAGPGRRSHHRHGDSELKLLAHISRRFTDGHYPGVRSWAERVPARPFTGVVGRVQLTSELRVCASCALVVGQFRRIFPRVDVELDSVATDLN